MVKNEAKNIRRGISKIIQSFSNEHNTNKFSLLTKCAYMILKGAVMQIEKTQINDPLQVSKVS